MNQMAQLILPHPSYNFNKLQSINDWVLPPLLGDKPHIHSGVIAPDGKHMPEKTPVARLCCAKKFCLLAAWLERCYLSLSSSPVKMQGLICSGRNIVPNQQDIWIMLNCPWVAIMFLEWTWGLSDICSLNLPFLAGFWSTEERNKIFLCNKRRVGLSFLKKTMNKE